MLRVRYPLSSFRNRRRARMLRKMANMRAAKAARRLANPPTEREPVLIRWHRLELGLRDKCSGQVAWIDFRSIRDAVRRLSLVRKYYLDSI